MAKAELAYGSYTQLSGGQNTAFDSAGIEPDQYSLGVNVIGREGVIRSRPSFNRVVQTFVSAVDRTLFREGRFQGGYWFASGDRDYAVAVISGSIFITDLDTGEVQNLSLQEYRVALDDRAELCWFCQAENYLIIQDGTSNPVILDGLSARHADPDKDEVPPGTAMAYGLGRLFVATGPRAVLAGDILDPVNQESILTFKETNDIDTGGYLTPGSDIGEITNLFFLSNVDTSTGSGPLIVSGTHGLVSLRVDVPRDEWENVVFRKFMVGETGVTGPWAETAMNTDNMFWSLDGLRSLSVMLAEVTSSRRFVNLSKEVAPLYEDDDPRFWKRVSLTVDNGRLLFTIGARTVPVNRTVIEETGELSSVEEEDVAFWGVVSLDFDHLRGKALQGQYVSTVSFDGVWTGPLFLQLLGRHDRTCFFGKDMTKDGGFNALYRIGDYRNGYDDSTPIKSRLVTRGFVMDIEPNYMPTPFIRKQFLSASIWPREVEFDVPLSVYLSLDDSQIFSLIGTQVLRAPVVEWDETRIEIPEAGAPHIFPGLKFPAPEFMCDPVTGGSLLTGYTFQFCLDWEGPLAFSRFLAAGTRDPKVSMDPCDQRVRSLVRTDGRAVETLFPFYRLDEFYRGDIDWYDRARDNLSITPEPFVPEVPGALLGVLDRDYIRFCSGKNIWNVFPLLTVATANYKTEAAVPLFHSFCVDDDGNLLLSWGNAPNYGIYKYEGIDPVAPVRLEKTETDISRIYWGRAMTRGPEGNLVSVAQVLSGAVMIPDPGCYVFYHTDFDLNSFDRFVELPAEVGSCTTINSMSFYRGNLVVANSNGSEIHFMDGDDYDYTFVPDQIPDPVAVVYALAFRDDEMLIGFSYPYDAGVYVYCYDEEEETWRFARIETFDDPPTQITYNYEMTSRGLLEL